MKSSHEDRKKNYSTIPEWSSSFSRMQSVQSRSSWSYVVHRPFLNACAPFCIWCPSCLSLCCWSTTPYHRHCIVSITIRHASGNGSCAVFVICFWKTFSQATDLPSHFVYGMFAVLCFAVHKISVFGEPFWDFFYRVYS